MTNMVGSLVKLSVIIKLDIKPDRMTVKTLHPVTQNAMWVGVWTQLFSLQVFVSLCKAHSFCCFFCLTEGPYRMLT